MSPSVIRQASAIEIERKRLSPGFLLLFAGQRSVLAALGLGLHVFCGKPLCYSPGEIEDKIAAQDASGKIVHVGYMKRFDPAYRLALDMLPGTADTLRCISVEVTDPDALPFIGHSRTRRD